MKALMLKPRRPDGVVAEGLALTVLPNRQVVGPVRLEALSGPVRVRVGAGSTVTLLEICDGAQARPETLIEVAAGAQVHHVRLQALPDAAELWARVTVNVAAQGAYRLVTLAMGGADNALDLGVTLAGEGAEAHLDGLAIALGAERVATHSEIVHATPGGHSRQLQKLLVGAGAQGEFLGRIRVERGAVGTEAVQTSRGLLLAPGARITARPELRIFTDAIACAHGTAIGALDPEAIFYLQARGLSEPDARSLLTAAFADEVLARAPQDLQDALRAAFSQRLEVDACRA